MRTSRDCYLLADRKCELGSSMDQLWCVSVFCFPAHICHWFASIIMLTETIGVCNGSLT